MNINDLTTISILLIVFIFNFKNFYLRKIKAMLDFEIFCL